MYLPTVQPSLLKFALRNEQGDWKRYKPESENNKAMERYKDVRQGSFTLWTFLYRLKTRKKHFRKKNFKQNISNIQNFKRKKFRFGSFIVLRGRPNADRQTDRQTFFKSCPGGLDLIRQKSKYTYE